jgi:hypothetical protein
MLSPVGSGHLVDPSGGAWSIRRRRLNPERVRGMLRRPDIPVLLSQTAGFDLSWVNVEARPALWDTIRKDAEYTCHEFADAEDHRLLFIEVSC